MARVACFAAPASKESDAGVCLSLRLGPAPLSAAATVLIVHSRIDRHGRGGRGARGPAGGRRLLQRMGQEGPRQQQEQERPRMASRKRPQGRQRHGQGEPESRYSH